MPRPETVSAGAVAADNRPVQDRRSASPQGWVPRCREQRLPGRIGRPRIPESAASVPVAAFPGDVIQAQARSWRPGCRSCAAGTGRAGALLPTGPAGELVTALLCTTMWITCVKRRRACAYTVEMLGIRLPGRARNRAFTWESAIRTLCIGKNLKLSTRHAAIADK